MEPIPLFALDDEFCRIGKICVPEHNFPSERLHRSSGSTSALGLSRPTRERSSALLRPRCQEPQATLRRLSQPDGQHRLGSPPDHPRPWSPEQSLALRLGLVSGSQRAWHIEVATEVMQKRPADDRGENWAVSCVKVHKAFAYACRVISKEIQHALSLLVADAKSRVLLGMVEAGL